MNNHSNSIVKTCEVIGVPVINSAKEDLGKIEEIILDKVKGQALYAVLSFGGIFGMNNKLFALPWKALNYDPNENCFMVNLSKKKLEQAPGFDKNHWPDWSDPQLNQSLNLFYGADATSKTPYEEKLF